MSLSEAKLDPGSVIVKRSISIRGHATSISIEDAFWDELRVIAAREGRPVAAIIASIDAGRPPAQNLSSAIRVHVLADALAHRTERPEAS